MYGLRKSRYEGTNQGTKGTVVNQTLLLLPRFPYKNIIIARYLDFRIGKKWNNRGTAESQNPCACSFSITYRFSTSILKIFMTLNNNFQKKKGHLEVTINQMQEVMCRHSVSFHFK